jgi:DNA-directed RNA polymerase specialized sigma24 family protein
VSPLTVRRYRAERLLRREFEALRGRVIATVRARLRGSGVSLDTSDLEACYAQAWQGLYMAVLDGQEIANPAGWLVLVTFRRAIEEHRARGRAHRGGDRLQGRAGSPQMGAELEIEGEQEHDLAAELDDRVRLRQPFEGLRGRLDGREREAAVLCYLQGLSRAQAAERMGVSEARMRKLMEGRGAGRPGVAGKVGTLVETIREGGWCEEQGSLMRGLAYGILDPDGERYQLALMHRSECPACRAYVTSLRGLAAAVPPVFLPCGLGAAVLARVGHGAHIGAVSGAASGGTGSAAAGGGASAGAGAQVGRGLSGTLSASGAAGAGAGAGGAAGGGWLLAGGAKLAVGCLLALGVGAGCIALNGGSDRPHSPGYRRHAARASGAGVRAHAPPIGSEASDLATGARRSGIASVSSRATATVPLTLAGRASREFGPEQALAPGAPRSVASEGRQAPTARSASSGSGPVTVAESSAGGSRSASVPASAGGESARRSSAGGESAAEREFAPG